MCILAHNCGCHKFTIIPVAMVAHFALLQVDVAVIGSSFLSVLDRLAFEVLPETGTITSGNISEIIIIATFPHSTSKCMTTIGSCHQEASNK